MADDEGFKKLVVRFTSLFQNPPVAQTPPGAHAYGQPTARLAALVGH